MAKNLDKIIIVDIESTCWDGKVPEGQTSEIIEIGICLLDVNSGEITQNEGIIVKPERSEVSDFCTELTTITPDMVEDGISFAEACRIIKKQYDGQGRAWASYGAYDFKMFQRQCVEMGIGYPFSPSHINVKTLFALKHKLDRETGMDGALKMLGMPLEGTHHRGIDDARNIAKIMYTLL